MICVLFDGVTPVRIPPSPFLLGKVAFFVLINMKLQNCKGSLEGRSGVGKSKCIWTSESAIHSFKGASCSQGWFGDWEHPLWTQAQLVMEGKSKQTKALPLHSAKQTGHLSRYIFLSQYILIKMHFRYIIVLFSLLSISRMGRRILLWHSGFWNIYMHMCIP